jgi:hypothetical protein
MEVHHHPKVEKRRFKEYFLEFIMILIAVILGFFAENLRESISNCYKEKEYIHSLIEDIKKDTSNINDVVNRIDYRDKGIDTFLSILMEPGTTLNSNRLFKLRENLGFPDFIYTNRTIEQLKSTGDLRLISELRVSNLIVSYDADARKDLLVDNILNNIIDGVIKITNHVLDFSRVKGWKQGGYDKLEVPVQPIPLVVSDKKTLIEYYNSISDYKRFALGFTAELIKLKDEGTRLIEALNQYYDFQDN